MGEIESRKAEGMTELLTAAQMRAIEGAAIASGSVTGLELMERAGQGVLDAVMAEWPDLAQTSHKAVVLCGPGNNGGDGFVVARLLKEWGWEVEVYLYGDPKKLPPDAKSNYTRWGGDVLPLEHGFEPSCDDDLHLIVDALFGTGLTRPIHDLGLTLLDVQEARAIGTLHQTAASRIGASARVVAVDIPSGLCSDSGKILTEEGLVGMPDVAAVRSTAADLTVTFHRMKLGHILADGPTLCGKVVITDIGL